MAFSLEPLISTQALLEFLQFFGIKLDDFAALYAEHVIMMLMAEGVFINTAVFGLSDPLDESAFAHQV